MGWTEGQTVELIDGKMDGRIWKNGRKEGRKESKKERKKGELFNRQANGWTDRLT